MRVPYRPRITVAGFKSAAKHHQRGGTLPGVQYGTGFFGNLLSSGLKMAVPALKAIGKAALPMAKEALAAGMASEGTVKQRLKKAAQTAASKKNLIALAKTGASGAMSRPF